VESWGFRRHPGVVADELLSVATTLVHERPHDIVAIVVGSSSHAVHRVLGSVAVNLSRRSPVPVVIVP
jgi:nucleotide-binding universal stress UspA family protein